MKQRKSLYSVSQLALARNKPAVSSQVPIKKPELKPTYKIHSESVDQSEVYQYRRGVQMPMPQRNSEITNLQSKENEEGKQPAMPIQRYNMPKAPQLPVQRQNYGCENSKYAVEVSIKQMEDYSNKNAQRQSALNYQYENQIINRQFSAEQNFSLQKENSKIANSKQGSGKKQQYNYGPAKSNEEASEQCKQEAWHYQVNPYPAVEDFQSDCAVQNPLSQLPPPRYSKQAPYARAQVNVPPNEVIDRKNLSNAAHQQLEHHSSTPVNLAVGSPRKKSEPENLKAIGNPPNRPEYKPYSLKDYKEIKPTKYYQLGGLGANIGNDQWKSRHEKLEKMNQYARRANSYNRDLRNGKKCPPPGTKLMAPETKALLERKERMKEYARRIPRPPKATTRSQRDGTREVVEEEEELSELEKLERQHNEYMQQVERIKDLL
eukprot:TRINITY_DN2293_c0_g1_i4.p1 TRINITY_DN2293_c0_g1~~TRINITY_DN2293_c0_g1_i4.p1  ORF type:complete len:433 (+),score=118.90 TRINITY_DN2293_c0_g1_i4:139-1437(+)